jgi:hypothetical protein
VAVTSEEIRLQLPEIQRDLSNAVGAVDQTQDSLFTADLRQPLEWKSNSRQARNHIEDGNLHIQPLPLRGLDNIQESPHELFMADRHLIVNLSDLHRSRLHERRDAFLDGAVDSLKVDDDIIALERQILQHGRYTRRGILDEYALVAGDIQ